MKNKRLIKIALTSLMIVCLVLLIFTLVYYYKYTSSFAKLSEATNDLEKIIINKNGQEDLYHCLKFMLWAVYTTVATIILNIINLIIETKKKDISNNKIK